MSARNKPENKKKQDQDVLDDMARAEGEGFNVPLQEESLEEAKLREHSLKKKKKTKKPSGKRSNT